MTQADELHALDQLAHSLHARFPGTPPEHIRQTIAEIHHQYDASRIRAFIPVLVEREIVERYRWSVLSSAKEVLRPELGERSSPATAMADSSP